MPKTIAQRIPHGSWDSHMHVVELKKYPLPPSPTYHPGSHTLEQALAFESSLGISNIVLIQPSFYGHDNSCLLDALQTLGSQRARGVVSFEPDTTPRQQLQEWHRLGVRGVRLNFQSNGLPGDNQQLERILHRYADAIRPLGWVLQVYIPMPLIESLEHIVPALNVRFCIDHFGQPTLSRMKSGDPYEIKGFKSLINLLQHGSTFVKLSAPYRISDSDGYADMEPIGREILRVGGMSRVVFATDWPHTRYENLIDIRPWVTTVLGWVEGDEALLRRVFKENAEELWDVGHS